MKKTLFLSLFLGLAIPVHATVYVNTAPTMVAYPAPYAGQQFYVQTPGPGQQWIYNGPVPNVSSSYQVFSANSGTATATPTITPTPTATGTPTMYPTLQATPTGTISFVGMDGKGNLKRLINGPSSNAPTTINLFAYTTFSEYPLLYDNEAFVIYNPWGIWLDSDGHNAIYFGYDLNDGRWNNPGALFFRFEASPSVETGPVYTRYEFEINGGDRYYQDFTENTNNLGSDWWSTYSPFYLFGGVQSSGATIAASAFAIQGPPVATLTPGPVTIGGTQNFQTSSGAATFVKGLYLGVGGPTPTPNIETYTIPLTSQQTPQLFVCTPCVTTSRWWGSEVGVVPTATPAAPSFIPVNNGVSITGGRGGPGTIFAGEAP